MARTKKMTIEGIDYIFQSVSPRWYLENADDFGVYPGGRRDTSGYHNSLLQNCVISPTELKSEGIEYFEDEKHGGFNAELKVIQEIERFLTGKTKSTDAEKGKKESQG